MRKIPEYLDDGLTTLTTCCYIKLRNGNAIGFTDHPYDLTIDNMLYAAENSFQSTSIESSANLSVDNLEIDGVIDSEVIKHEDLLTGLYDYAYVEIFVIDYQPPQNGKILLKSGHIGEVRFCGQKFIAEIRGLSQKLNVNIGKYYSPTCRTNFGSKQCKINLSAYQQKAAVVSLINGNNFTIDKLMFENNWYQYGSVQFITGQNKNLSLEIRDVYTNIISLMLGFPYPINIGDEFVITPGCDKRFSTCCERYNNAINFRGEPTLPGMDEILKTSGTFR